MMYQSYILIFAGYNLKVLHRRVFETFYVQAMFRSKCVGTFVVSLVPNFTTQLKQKLKEKFRMAAMLLYMTQRYVLPELKAHTAPRCFHK
jgi:hypothetical protein